MNRNLRAAVVLDMARAKRLRVVTAESCTGGLVSAALTDIPGSSDVFDRGFLTYSYAAKTEMLGVGTELLATHGAVSSEVAQAMAEGALARSDGHLSIAVTGVAGPGASDAKPEGMVWFAVANGAQTATKRQDFGPLGRANVRSASVDFALDFAAQILGRTL